MSDEVSSPASGYTIGEVLNQLKEDFGDITISKIRFLESEGLVSPGRTDAGYRKFSDDDVDRLRFILTAQRDHYLPLKVIREQLDRLDADELPVPPGPPPPPGHTRADTAADQADADSPDAARSAPGALQDPPEPASMGVGQFSEASGLEPGEVRALREFGVIGDRGDDDAAFDGEDVAAARAAKELLRLGLEPRHLRMYRQFVEREISLFEQLVAPQLRQRNPEARRQATSQLENLVTRTGALHGALLTRALRAYIHRS